MEKNLLKQNTEKNYQSVLSQENEINELRND